MPDPVWTFQYNVSSTPETNGFSRKLTKSPVVNEVRTGPTNSRRVEINSANGDAVFETTSPPGLLDATGATMEVTINLSSNTSSESHAGCELTFSNYAVIFQVHPTFCRVYIPSDNSATPTQEYDVVTGNNNSDIVWRLTFDATKQVRLYRAGTLIAGPYTARLVSKPNKRVLWWAEAGGVASFKGIKYYIGGAVAPG